MKKYKYTYHLFILGNTVNYRTEIEADYYILGDGYLKFCESSPNSTIKVLAMYPVDRTILESIEENN